MCCKTYHCNMKPRNTKNLLPILPEADYSEALARYRQILSQKKESLSAEPLKARAQKQAQTFRLFQPSNSST